MNGATVWHLTVKDWYLHRVPVTFIIAGSITAVGLLMIPDEATASVGLNLALAALIAATFYLPVMTVVEERGRRTLTFLMSLPVSSIDYVASKIVANVTLYLAPWATLALGASLIVTREGSTWAASGWIPIVLVGMAANFVFILTVALITESGGWTVGLTILLLFLFGNVFTQVLPNNPLISQVFESIDNRGPAYTITLLAETLVIVILLSATFVVQSRKTDYA